MSSPAFQFYPKEFMLATQAWSADEVGIYIKLLCSQWDDGGLPNDTKRLARIAGCDSDIFEKAWVLVGLKFSECNDGFLRNSRLELVRGEQDAYKEKQRLNGIKGGRPPKINPTNNPELTQPETQIKPNPKPNPNPKKTPSYSANNSTKVEYSKDVFLSEVEYSRLVNEYGKDLTNKCIVYLSNWFLEKPFKKKETTNHNLTIRRWVIDAVRKKDAEQQAFSGNCKRNYNSDNSNVGN